MYKRQDPEGEYFPIVRAFNGQVVRISPTSHDYINPMDINTNYADDDDPLSLKSDFILSLCELVVGGKNGLEPVEKTIIDRCVRLVYQDYLADPVPEKMPILEDLYNLLRKQEEPEAQRLATALEIYVNGSLKVFNHRTNVELNNRLVCFDIKDLGKQLKKLGMLIVQDQVWNRVTVNRAAHKSTRYYIDEFHLLLKEEQTAAYSVEIWKRFRKWGGIPTGITQNVKDLLASREIENIFENSDFILMLNQASGDRQILAKQLNISPHQLSYVTNSGAGEGLIFYGNTIIPFKDRFDNSLMLYALMSSKPEDVEKGLPFDRMLYIARREFEQSNDNTYVVSMSSRTIVYKGMFLVGQLRTFFEDLQSPDYESAIAMVHSRFSTNTNPSWERAHPNRFMVHNGEINTIRGNADKMLAREENMESPYLEGQLHKVLPVVNRNGSDSAMLDNTLEFLVMSGMELPLAVMITIPEPWANNDTISQAKRDFYQYYATMMEPWDGPASILFSDGDVMGCLLYTSDAADEL